MPAGPRQGSLVPLGSLGRKAGCFPCPPSQRARVPAPKEQLPPPHRPPAPALHVSKALPLPSLSPAASRTPRSFGVGWDSTASEAAKQQEQMRPPRSVAQKKRDEPPHPSRHPPRPCAGGSRDAPEHQRSEGPREGCEPTHIAGTAAADAYPPGEPGWGAEHPPPPPMANKALGERCEILPPFLLLHRRPLRLRPRHLARRGSSRGACGRVCRQGLSWDPSVTLGLAWASLRRERAPVSRRLF